MNEVRRKSGRADPRNGPKKKKEGHLVWETWQKRSNDKGSDMSTRSR